MGEIVCVRIELCGRICECKSRISMCTGHTVCQYKINNYGML